MLSKGTCVKIVAVSLLAVAVQHIARLVVSSGIFTHHYKHFPGPCRKVENIQLGSEDFYTLPDGLTFISSGFRMQNMGRGVEEHFRKNKLEGRMYLFDFKKADAGVKELKIRSTDLFNVDTFHPHGVGVWEDKKAGRHVVFVVNHPLEEPVADRIEKFIFDPNKLELLHQAYYSGEAMKSVNDVQPTGEDSFYFTNYQYFRNRVPVTLETLLQLRITDVVHFDANNYTVVADDLASANGIAMSKDGQYIYVAPCLGQEIRVFRRNKDNSLTLQQIFPLYTIPDNIQVDHTTGDLYVGCHPIAYKVLLHMEEPSEHLAPSQVLQLRVKDGNITSAQELLYDHGELISGSTSALVYNRKLLVGSIFHNLVTCDVNIPL
ncbi:serum paraoxonase/arylesterase 1-like isoform X2 [Littorina saxatilis]|uniref:Paraoxonase n=2 Tax=Littorina saxatilis TaxID=31220 RepID=A0AAN9GKH5_9CAEN